jgi:hypothetical protein
MLVPRWETPRGDNRPARGALRRGGPAPHHERPAGGGGNATTAAAAGGGVAQAARGAARGAVYAGGLRGGRGGRKPRSAHLPQPPAHPARRQHRDGRARRLAGKGRRDGSPGDGARPRGQLAQPLQGGANGLHGQRGRDVVFGVRSFVPRYLQAAAERAAHPRRPVVPQDDVQLQHLV